MANILDVQEPMAPTTMSPTDVAEANLLPPDGARGCWISASTTDVLLNFTDQAVTISTGLRLKAGVPQYFPFAKKVRALAAAVGTSVVVIQWVK